MADRPDPSPKPPRTRPFRRAQQDAATARAFRQTPQTADPSYRLAFQDTDFLLRDDLRPIRFQLELLKPELIFNEAGIASTFVFYGSARIPSPDHADALVKAAKTETQRRIAKSLAAKSVFYEEARKLAQIASHCAPDEDGRRHFIVCSGGGPSIMEAANRGARDAGCDTIGLNIVLPHEQAPNPYVTPHLSLNFHYFALRKMHFLLRARAVAVFPGGYGTLDEMFEMLTLIQTGKMALIPILLFGEAFWRRIVNFDALVEEGTIAPQDLDLFHFVETAEDAWHHVEDFYARAAERGPAKES